MGRNFAGNMELQQSRFQFGVVLQYKQCHEKKKVSSVFENSEDVFDSLGPQLLNQHLKKTMVGLSTKGFRTYSVTKTLQDELCEIKQKNS